MIDQEYIKSHYAQLNDDELVRLSKTDLVPEARAILDKELQSRGQEPAVTTPADATASNRVAEHQRRVSIRRAIFTASSLAVLFVASAIANKSLGSGIGAAIGGAVGAAFAMFFLRLSMKIVVKHLPPLGTAYVTTLVGGVACYLANLLFAYAAAQAGRELTGVGYLVLVGVNIFIYASVLDLLLKLPDSRPLGFWRGCLVAIIQFITVFALVGGTYYVGNRIAA